MSAPRLTVLFHDSTSVIAFLNSTSGRGFAGDLLVECASQPALGYVLNLETPASYPGVAGLLGGADIGTLAHATERLPAPIVLAPGAPVARPALRDALGQLQKPDERLAAITLLVPINEARAFGSALAMAERFVVAWDVTVLPHEELPAFAAWLGTEGLIDEDRFEGLFPYSTARLDGPHSQRLQALLTPIANRVPAIRSTIVPAY